MSDAFAEDSEFPSPLPLPKGERIKVRGIWLFDDLVILWGNFRDAFHISFGK